jgi:hypothetical protein
MTTLDLVVIRSVALIPRPTLLCLMLLLMMTIFLAVLLIRPTLAYVSLVLYPYVDVKYLDN